MNGLCHISADELNINYFGIYSALKATSLTNMGTVHRQSGSFILLAPTRIFVLETTEEVGNTCF